MSEKVLVVLRMSPEDAETLWEDWRYDPAAPLLSGGWQENPLTYEPVPIERAREEILEQA